MRVNFLSCVWTTFAAIPHMLRQGRGTIVNISSFAAKVAPPREPLYAASKSAMNSFTEGLWNDLAGSNIHVGLINPGRSTRRSGRRRTSRPTTTKKYPPKSSPMRPRGDRETRTSRLCRGGIPYRTARSAPALPPPALRHGEPIRCRPTSRGARAREQESAWGRDRMGSVGNLPTAGRLNDRLFGAARIHRVAPDRQRHADQRLAEPGRRYTATVGLVPGAVRRALNERAVLGEVRSTQSMVMACDGSG